MYDGTNVPHNKNNALEKITYSRCSHAQNCISPAIKLSNCHPGIVAYLIDATGSMYTPDALMKLQILIDSRRQKPWTYCVAVDSAP
jgi:hypothetical protein